MKTSVGFPRIPRIASLSVSIAAVLATLLTGCSTPGYKKSGATALSFQEMAMSLRSESIALDATMASLNELTQQPATDLKPQYKRFSHNLDHFIAAVNQTDNSAKRMQQKSKVYFDAWDQELATMKFGAVRESSENRKAAVLDHFNRVHSRYETDQAVARPLILYLSDIRRALETDLTAGGLAAVKNVVSTADANANKLQTALSQLTGELAESGMQFSSIVVLNQ
jgi:hypothetical protein